MQNTAVYAPITFEETVIVMTIIIIVVVEVAIIIVIIIVIISNSNWTEWSTIQGVIG